MPLAPPPPHIITINNAPGNAKCPRAGGRGGQLRPAENQRSKWGDGGSPKDPTRGADIPAWMGGEALSAVQAQHGGLDPAMGLGKAAEGTLGAESGRERRAGPAETSGLHPKSTQKPRERWEQRRTQAGVHFAEIP